MKIKSSYSKLPDACIIWVTCSTTDEAKKIAETLVNERLAACVQVIGGSGSITSFYIWEGNIHQESEVLLMIKTRFSQRKRVQDRILSLHSYTTPEIITIRINDVFPAYLQWIEDCIPLQE